MIKVTNYEKQYNNLINILDSIKKKSERKLNSRDLLDTIDFIEQKINANIPDEYQKSIDFQKDRIKFNFWIYYDELEEYCNNEVVILKDFSKFSIKSNYGNIDFFETFDISKSRIKKSEELPSELTYTDEDNLYELNIDRKEEVPNKEEIVIKYYVLCNRLKDLIRTGWKDWNVSRNRVESVAEHVFKTQQLALAMKYTYHYDVDIFKVIMMLAIHETEETIIGDLTQFQINKLEKEKMGHKAVHDIFKNIMSSVELESLVYEFDERKTKEAIFAFECDKLECDLQARLYDLEKCVDVKKQQGNKTAEDPIVKALLDKGMSFSEMWMSFGQSKYNYDNNFMRVSEYAKTHEILKK